MASYALTATVSLPPPVIVNTGAVSYLYPEPDTTIASISSFAASSVTVHVGAAPESGVEIVTVGSEV